MKGKLLFSLLVVALLSMSLVSAKNVARWTYYSDDHFIMPANSDENPCDFDIDWAFEGSGFIIGWWDETGEIVRLFDVLNQIDETFNANGKSLKLKGITIHYSFLPDNKLLLSYLGVSGYAVVPGYGPVWGGAGNGTTIYQYDPERDEWIWIETVRDVGNLNYDDFYPVCEYLSP